MVANIPDREAFLTQCEDQLIDRLCKGLTPVLRDGFRGVIETVPHRTNRMMKRDVIISQSGCALDKTADEILSDRGFSDQLLDQVLYDSRAALWECIEITADALRIDIRNLIERFGAAACAQYPDPKLVGTLIEEIQPVVVEIYRQWLMKNYTFADLDYVMYG